MFKLKFTVSALLTAFILSATAQSTNPSPYCNGGFDDVDGTMPVADHIRSVSFGTLNNVSTTQYALPHYVFYNNLPTANFAKGQSYTITVVMEVDGGAGCGVWIDYNHNNTFEANEKVAGTDSTCFLAISSSTTVTKTISIPATAITGNTRMRVRIVEDDTYTAAHGAAILPCNAGTTPTDIMDWGETEDYTINITGTTGITEATSPDEMTLYPNPATNHLTVAITSAQLDYRITDLLGSTVQTGILPSGASAIDISGLHAGIYVITAGPQQKSFAIVR